MPLDTADWTEIRYRWALHSAGGSKRVGSRACERFGSEEVLGAPDSRIFLHIRRPSSRTWGTPAVLVVLACWLLAVPLVLAATGQFGSDRTPAQRPVVRAAALPGCTIVGTAASETLVGTP